MSDTVRMQETEVIDPIKAERELNLAKYKKALARRSFIKTAGLAGISFAAGSMIVGCGVVTSKTSAQAIPETDVLNFALNLEYLEGEFYSVAVTGSTLSSSVTGGTSKATGGKKVTFSDNRIADVQLYVEGINKRETLQVKLEIAPAPGRLPNEVEIALFRVVQAALANVHLHSGTKSATIRFAQDSDKLILEIIDRGRGFKPEALRKSGSVRATGVGLLGIKERLQLIGGRLEIETGSDGTILRSVVPIASSVARPS